MQVPFAGERRLVSLWDIVNEYRAGQFWWMSQELLRLETDFTGPLDKAQAFDLSTRLDFVKTQCEHAGLKLTDLALVPLCNIGAELMRLQMTSGYQIDVDGVKREFKALRKNLELELCKRKFVRVAEDKSKYFEQDQLFGKDVYDKFSSTRFDLKEAGNALCCGLNTAAGFHLMRAAEIGLRELGRDRQIPSVSKIDYMDWGDIIHELEKEVPKIQQWPNSEVKEEAHRFYNRALVEVRAFNDGWRRHLAHVRQSQIPLDDTEALALCGHVERFLKTLATKIAEGQYTLLEWTQP